LGIVELQVCDNEGRQKVDRIAIEEHQAPDQAEQQRQTMLIVEKPAHSGLPVGDIPANTNRPSGSAL
jgi:hypothetical protein